MDRQVPQVNRRVLRMDRRVLQVKRRALRVSKQVIQELQVIKRVLRVTKRVVQVLRITLWVLRSWKRISEISICDNFIYLHLYLNLLVTMFTKISYNVNKTLLCGKNYCEIPHWLLFYGKCRSLRIKIIFWEGANRSFTSELVSCFVFW